MNNRYNNNMPRAGATAAGRSRQPYAPLSDHRFSNHQTHIDTIDSAQPQPPPPPLVFRPPLASESGNNGNGSGSNGNGVRIRPLLTASSSTVPSSPTVRMKQRDSVPRDQRPVLRTTSINTLSSFFLHLDTDHVLDALFNKLRSLKTGRGPYQLPNIQEICTYGEECDWKIPQLLDLKARLNSTKSKLDRLILRVWHDHTSLMNPAADVISAIRFHFRPEFCTQAWCKFYECLSHFPQIIPPAVTDKYEELVKALATNNNNNTADNEAQAAAVPPTVPLISLHLCEAPGAFISALNHYLHSNFQTTDHISWSWLGTTLSPYWEGNSPSELINSDILIQSSMDNWTFLQDGTGNLMSRANVQDLIRAVKKKYEQRQVDLVTADGSVDCQLNPCEQERRVVGLHFAEIVTALHVLGKGGSFVLKIFTFLESPTISHLYLLSCLFGELHLFKPATSREGNSEVYVICLNYLGCEEQLLARLLEHFDSINNEDLIGTKALFPLRVIPQRFMNLVSEAAKYFVETQISAIDKNLHTFPETELYQQLLIQTKLAVVQHWIYQATIRHLTPDEELFKDFEQNGIDFSDPKDQKFKTHSDEIRAHQALTENPALILKYMERDLTSFRTYLLERMNSDGRRKLIRPRSRHRPQQGVTIDPATALVIKKKNSSLAGIALKGGFRLIPRNFSFNKPYAEIHSSKFCSTKLLEQRTRLRKIVQMRKEEFLAMNPALFKCKSCMNLEQLAEGLKSVLRNTFQGLEVPELHLVLPEQIGQIGTGCQKQLESVVIVLCFWDTLLQLASQTDIELTWGRLQMLINLITIGLEASTSIFLCSYPLLSRLHIGLMLCFRLLFEQVILTADGLFLYKFKGFIMSDDEAVEAAREEGGDSTTRSALFMDSKPCWTFLRSQLASNPTGIGFNSTLVLAEVLPLQRLCTTPYSNLIYAYNVSCVVNYIEVGLEHCQQQGQGHRGLVHIQSAAAAADERQRLQSERNGNHYASAVAGEGGVARVTRSRSSSTTNTNHGPGQGRNNNNAAAAAEPRPGTSRSIHFA